MLLKQMKPEEFDAVYDLMEKSFPVDEYRPYEKQKELLSLPAFQIYVAKEEDSEDIKGFAAVWDFDWLVYDAAQEEYQIRERQGMTVIENFADLEQALHYWFF